MNAYDMIDPTPGDVGFLLILQAYSQPSARSSSQAPGSAFCAVQAIPEGAPWL